MGECGGGRGGCGSSRRGWVGVVVGVGGLVGGGGGGCVGGGGGGGGGGVKCC